MFVSVLLKTWHTENLTFLGKTTYSYSAYFFQMYKVYNNTIRMCQANLMLKVN